MWNKYIAREPEVDVVLMSNKDDATLAAAGVIYHDTDPELGDILNKDLMLGEIMFGGKWRFKFIW